MADPSSGPKGPVNGIVHVAGNVVSGLQSSPAMLALIVLNMIGIGAALWFLHEISTTSRGNFQMLLKFCLTKGNGP